MTDINKPVNLNEMIKSIIMRIKLIRCIELKAIVTLSLVITGCGAKSFTISFKVTTLEIVETY